MTHATTAAVVTHDVENLETWQAAFAAHADARKSAGIVASHVNRHADDGGRLSVYLAASDKDRLAAFLASPDLIRTMRDAGVKGPPHIAAITPVEDRTVRDRPLAGVIIKHSVRDYDTWKVAFDGHAPARTAAGIVGHAVNRAERDPNVVVVYLQAESLDALRAFASSPDVKSVMQAAGVTSAPEFTFVHGGAWES